MRRGLTLLETLVACGSLVIVLFMALGLVVAAQGVEASSFRFASLVRDLNRLADFMERDLRGVRFYWVQETYPGGRNYAYGDLNLGFPSPLDETGRVVTDTTGRSVGQRWVVYYNVTKVGLMRATSTDQGPFQRYVPDALQRGLINSRAGELVGPEVTLGWQRYAYGMELSLSGTRTVAGRTLESVVLQRYVRVNVAL